MGKLGKSRRLIPKNGLPDIGICFFAKRFSVMSTPGTKLRFMPRGKPYWVIGLEAITPQLTVATSVPSLSLVAHGLKKLLRSG